MSHATPPRTPNAPANTHAINERDAAVYIDMSVAFLRASRCATREGTPGPPFIRIGRAIRYLRADLDAWLRAHRVELVCAREPSQPLAPSVAVTIHAVNAEV